MSSLASLQFGMQLPIQAQTTTIAQAWEPSCGPDELALIAKACDESGWHYVGVCDHVAIPRDRAAAMSTTWYDTIATLGWIAGFTKRVNLVSTVLVLPYRHPLVVAKAFCTLDALSNGRAILGVGAGHLEAEFGLLGVPFKRRGRLTDEALTTIKAVFTDEWGAGEFGVRPRPVQPGGPSIWVGGSTEAALRRAAKFADVWLPQGPPPQGMDQAIADLKRYRAEAGLGNRPIGVIGSFGMFLGKPSNDLPPGVVVGNPELVAEKVREQAAAGFTHLQPRPVVTSANQYAEQVEAFGKNVIPLLR